jgi:hypothetical protein
MPTMTTHAVQAGARLCASRSFSALARFAGVGTLRSSTATRRPLAPPPTHPTTITTHHVCCRLASYALPRRVPPQSGGGHPLHGRHD